MRTFGIYDWEGSQERALAHVTSPAKARRAVIDLPDGTYAVRDCLGGLRLRLRKVGAVITDIERTPT